MSDGASPKTATAADEARELRARLDVLAAVADVVADVEEAAVDATDPEDVHRFVCDRLVETPVLRSAWVGVLDEETGVVEPTVWAGVDDDRDETSTGDESHPAGTELAGTALRTGEVQMARTVSADESRSAVGEAELPSGSRSAASVPLSDGDDAHGVLTMSAEREGAFADESSRGLANLGRALARAVDALPCRNRERELERRAEEFSTVVGDIEEYAIFRLDADGRVESWNRGAESIKGYSREEILGEHIRTFYTESAREEGVPESLLSTARTEGRVEAEGWRVRSDGTRFWASVVITALTDDDGRVRGFTKVTRDMTERKRRERHLDAVFNSTVQFMGLLDTDGTVLRLNDAATQYGDVDRADVVGKKAWETPGWREDEARASRLRDAVSRAAEGEFVGYEVEVDAPGCDDPLVLDFSLTPVRDEDGSVSLLVPEARDITARKERERELRRERERLEFMNRILRHNLLNGLNVVGARVDILRDFVEPAGETHLETVGSRVDEMTDLVATMRTFTKAIVDGETQEFEARSLVDAVAEQVAEVRRSDPEVTVTVGSIPDIPVLADDLLGEVVGNLLGNAVKHNDKADPRVHVEAAAGDDVVELRVDDNGPGVPNEQKRRIVEKSVDELSNPNSGFGLFIVREVVESYGGDVRIEDNDPEGATFVVTLPRA